MGTTTVCPMTKFVRTTRRETSASPCLPTNRSCVGASSPAVGSSAIDPGISKRRRGCPGSRASSAPSVSGSTARTAHVSSPPPGHVVNSMRSISVPPCRSVSTTTSIRV